MSSPPSSTDPNPHLENQDSLANGSTSSSLILLPPSPTTSSSSLTSDETAFDHLASINNVSQNDNNTGQTSQPSILGLRDLMKMHKNEKANKKALALASQQQRNPSVPIPRSAQTFDNGIVEIIDELPPSYPGIIGSGLHEQEVFAKQVIIKGYKIVGGSDWKDVARLGAYVVYDIEISLRNGGNVEILRRYTDFVNLRNLLKAKYPTMKDAIPQLPGKAHFSKFQPEFLEQRQPRLQRFLRAVILHPEMGKGGKGSIVGDWVVGKGKPNEDILDF
ncbi:uncharacterized protein L201_002912 [Kwoniella dendrophila CBS 6074]|uniref:PX domain-containing protein n=1 Tax=Kwoniella dendrophila CBS 6074 TaxID=1295534 RepID=A0AAX4JTU8_9TREE